MTSSHAGARAVLVILLVIAAVLVGAVAFPFLRAIFIACVLAGALGPVYEHLTRRMRGRRYASATVMTILLIVAVVLPVATIATLALKEGLEAITMVQETLRKEGVDGLVERLPRWAQPAGERLAAEMPTGQDGLQDLAAARGDQAAAAVGGVVMATSAMALQTAMMLVAFFFLLIDGKKLVDWIDRTLPLRHVQLVHLLSEFRRVSVAVLVSSLATAGVQAVAALVGYMIVRVPNMVFFTLLTFFIGLIPAIGAAAVVLFVSVLLLLGGHPGSAGFLAIWGIVVVGLIDNLVKPLLIKGEVELHGAVVFFALLGGLAVFGPVGLIAGPLIVSFFLSIVKLTRRELEGRPPGPTLPPTSPATLPATPAAPRTT